MLTLTLSIACEVQQLNKRGNTLHKEGSRAAAEEAVDAKVVVVGEDGTQ